MILKTLLLNRRVTSNSSLRRKIIQVEFFISSFYINLVSLVVRINQLKSLKTLTNWTISTYETVERDLSVQRYEPSTVLVMKLEQVDNRKWFVLLKAETCPCDNLARSTSSSSCLCP
eukprot:g17862.t1